MKAYILCRPEIPWGDYGAILLSGMAARLSQENDLLHLERTGPFVPPISVPSISSVVVAESLKAKLETSGLTSFTFQPVIKKHIVHLEWEKWDRETPEPPMYPETGEPEDCILSQPHSPSLANDMEPLWEMVLEQTASAERVQIGPRPWDVNIYLVLSSWNGSDFFRAKGVGYNYISERARQWLEQEVPEWVGFEEALSDNQMAECVR
jgi:hypothetical protein